MKDNLRPLNVLQRAIAISHDGKQQLAIFGMGKDIDGLAMTQDSHICRPL
jgi:hypothetical protein